ncbi:MAG TPA: NAD-dependent epimerase/dehydratase family protein, partial [Bacteroidetes bacterium]|nr:NAD-dependent epimerase/dehydratase family protein [Bacteroidota bacterium]
MAPARRGRQPAGMAGATTASPARGRAAGGGSARALMGDPPPAAREERGPFVDSSSHPTHTGECLTPTPESSAIRPQYPYALSKYLGEQCVLHWAQIYELPTASLRLFNVYGPRSRTSGTYGAVF